MSVTTTLASTADTISAPFGANIFLDTIVNELNNKGMKIIK